MRTRRKHQKACGGFVLIGVILPEKQERKSYRHTM
jgi:hypothetical protein